jgi:hypothetical protein
VNHLNKNKQPQYLHYLYISEMRLHTKDIVGSIPLTHRLGQLSLSLSTPLLIFVTGKCRSNANVSRFLVSASVLVGGDNPIKIVVGFSSTHSLQWKVGLNNAIIN